jgi:hypothetical protein
LGFLGQPREVRLEIGVVVSAGTAVQQHDGGPLAHLRAVRHERRPVDVEPQSRPVHLHVHATLRSSRKPMRAGEEFGSTRLLSARQPCTC